MRNIKLTLRYDGSGFNGWQTQPGYRTVQETLEQAIAKLTGEERIRANASGRTDAGVHAIGQVLNFYSNTALSPDVLVRALNAYLPADMAVRAAAGHAQALHAHPGAPPHPRAPPRPRRPAPHPVSSPASVPTPA